MNFGKFFTDFKKLSVEFLIYKESYPIRTEAINLISILINNSKSPGNKYLYDELVKNFKKHKLLAHEFNTIKNNIKGSKVKSVFVFLTMILINENSDLSKMIMQENGDEYLAYAINKDLAIAKQFPFIVKFINDIKRKAIVD